MRERWLGCILKPGCAYVVAKMEYSTVTWPNSLAIRDVETVAPWCPFEWSSNARATSVDASILLSIV